MILSSNDPGTRGMKALLGPVKEAHQSHAIEFGLWPGTMNVKHITASTGPFMCGGHHPHLLLEWPSVFTLLLSSILAVAPVWHLFLPWLTLFCPHPRSSQLYRNTMRPGYTTDPYMHLWVFLNIIILSPWPQATAVVVGSIAVSILELRKTETQRSGD